MTITNEQSNIHELTSEDRRLIISLLVEYSGKLLNICEKIDKNRRYRLFAISVFSVSLTIAIELLIISEIFNLFLIILCCFVFIAIISEIQGKIKLLKRDANTISVKLKKVIRTASQIEEHVLNNLASRMESDLRLTEAETALQHHYIDNNQGLLQRILNW